MAAKPAKGTKRNPLQVTDLPYPAPRTANYWVEFEGEFALSGRVIEGELISLEINPSPMHRVVGRMAEQTIAADRMMSRLPEEARKRLVSL